MRDNSAVIMIEDMNKELVQRLETLGWIVKVSENVYDLTESGNEAVLEQLNNLEKTLPAQN